MIIEQSNGYFIYWNTLEDCKTIEDFLFTSGETRVPNSVVSEFMSNIPVRLQFNPSAVARYWHSSCCLESAASNQVLGRAITNISIPILPWNNVIGR